MDFYDLLHVREWVAIGYAHGSHESRLVLVQKIHGDRPVTVLRLLVRFGANDERCRCHKLAFVMLSGSATCICGVSVFANKALGIRVVHCFHESAFSFWRHRRFTDSQGIVDAAKQPGQVHVADFVGLDAQVGAVDAE